MPVVPGREADRGRQRDMTLEHQGEALASCSCGRAAPMATVRVTSVVAVQILGAANPPGASSARLRHAGWCLPVRAIVDDRAVRPGARDGVERQVLQKAPVASRKASSLETTSTSSGRVWPAPPWRPSAGSGSGAAPSRTWAVREPSISTAFLQARGRAHGVGVAHHLRRPPSPACRSTRPRTARDRSARVALQLGQGVHGEIVRLRPRSHLVARARRQVGRVIFAGSRNSSRRAVGIAGWPGPAAEASGSRRRRGY